MYKFKVFFLCFKTYLLRTTVKNNNEQLKKENVKKITFPTY